MVDDGIKIKSTNIVGDIVLGYSFSISMGIPSLDTNYFSPVTLVTPG
jgi:hypothetical protein